MSSMRRHSATFSLYLFLPILAAFTSGCVPVSTKIRKLPAYDRAVQIQPVVRKPVALIESQVDLSSLPAMIPYAQITGAAARNSSGKAVFHRILERALEEKPDYVLISDKQAFVSGSTGIHWGYGISTSQLTYGARMTATLYRVLPCHLGFTLDEDGVVTSRQSKAARESGILEGDRLLSFNNRPAKLPSLGLSLLSSQPGQIFHLIWLRPGKGRMEGSLKLVENEVAPDGSLPHTP